MTTRIYLVRHGATVLSAEDAFAGGEALDHCECRRIVDLNDFIRPVAQQQPGFQLRAAHGDRLQDGPGVGVDVPDAFPDGHLDDVGDGVGMVPELDGQRGRFGRPCYSCRPSTGRASP